MNPPEPAGTPIARAYGWLMEGLGLLAGLAFAAMALLIGADVLLRNLALGNLPWVIEVVEYLLYLATFAAAPWVLYRGGHVRVDLLVTQLPPRAGRLLELLSDAIGLVICLLLAWFGAQAALQAQAIGALVFKELVLPEWPLLAAIPVAAGLLALEFVRRLARALQPGRSG